MKPRRALSNIAEQYRFQSTISGARCRRLLYLTVYYLSWLLFRWGDRHTRALNILRGLGLSDRRALLRLTDGLRLELDLYTAYDALHPIYIERVYEPDDGFAPSTPDLEDLFFTRIRGWN